MLVTTHNVNCFGGKSGYQKTWSTQEGLAHQTWYSQSFTAWYGSPRVPRGVHTFTELPADWMGVGQGAMVYNVAQGIEGTGYPIQWGRRVSKLNLVFYSIPLGKAYESQYPWPP